MLPSRRVRVRIPTPPPFRNHGAEVDLGCGARPLPAARAEEAGAYVLTETAARAADRDRRAGRRRPLRRQGPRRATATPLSQLRAGQRHQGRGDGARRGQLGSPDGGGDPRVRSRRRSRAAGLGARRQGGLAGRPAARPGDPHARAVAAEAPRPLRAGRRHVDLPDARRAHTARISSSIGFVLDLDYADATTSAHDLLQLFKQHPLVRGILAGGERVGWGAKALPGGGWWSMPKLIDAGRRAGRRRRRDGRHGRAEGRAPRDQLRPRSPRRRSTPRCDAATTTSSDYERSLEQSVTGRGALPRPQRPPALPARLRARRAAGQPRDRDEGPASAGPPAMAPQRRAARCSSARPRAPIRSPTDATRSTSSPRSTSAATRPATTRRTTSACARSVPRELAETWRWMCPGGRLRDRRRRTRPRRRRRDRELHQLRAVRGDHGQGRSSDDARGRRRPALPADVAVAHVAEQRNLCAAAVLFSNVMTRRRRLLRACCAVVSAASLMLAVAAAEGSQPSPSAVAASAQHVADGVDGRNRPGATPLTATVSACHTDTVGREPLRDLRVADDARCRARSRCRSTSSSRSAAADGRLRGGARGARVRRLGDLAAAASGSSPTATRSRRCPRRQRSACSCTRAGSAATAVSSTPASCSRRSASQPLAAAGPRDRRDLARSRAARRPGRLDASRCATTARSRPGPFQVTLAVGATSLAPVTRLRRSPPGASAGVQFTGPRCASGAHADRGGGPRRARSPSRPTPGATKTLDLPGDGRALRAHATIG